MGLRAQGGFVFCQCPQVEPEYLDNAKFLKRENLQIQENLGNISSITGISLLGR
jgi:hypothetical protein